MIFQRSHEQQETTVSSLAFVLYVVVEVGVEVLVVVEVVERQRGVDCTLAEEVAAFLAQMFDESVLRCKQFVVGHSDHCYSVASIAREASLASA